MEKDESIEKNTKENQKEIEELKSEKTEDIKDVEEKTEEKLTPEEELINIKDKLARTFAEMENQRRRYEKEKEDAFEYGGFSFAREALNLLDNLERSKITLENDETIKNTDTLKKVLEHFEIINKDLLSIFKKNNIEPIKSINEKLDPNLHQAMMEIEDDTKEPGTIIPEIQTGFTIKDRLLRPSLVGVSKKVTIKEEKTEENQENPENK